LLVVLSKGYLASPWCGQEREAFLKANPNGQFFIVKRDKIEPDEQPEEFREILGYQFWKQDEENRAPVPLGYPVPNPKNPSHERYYNHLNDLAHDLAEKLKELKGSNEASIRKSQERIPVEPVPPPAPEPVLPKKVLEKAAVWVEPEKEQRQETDGRFVAYSDGTVKDTKTGLVWASRDNGKDIAWQEAKAYCESRGNGWRMPTLEELKTLIGTQNGATKGFDFSPNADNYIATKLIHLTCYWVWASDTKDVGSRAAYVGFLRGYADWSRPGGSYGSRALPVRGGK
jgi:hypothetical protein